MRLLIDARLLLDAQPTGVGYYTMGMLTALQELNDPRLTSVTLVTAGRTRHAHTIRTRYPTFRHRHLTTPNKVLNAAHLLGFGGGFRTRRTSDYLWMPNLNVMDSLSAVPYALTVHDMSFWTRPRYYSRRSRLWHRLTRFQKLAARADRIATVSHNTKQELLDLFPSLAQKEIRVIYPGSPPDTDQAGAREFKDRYVLFLGTAEERKNVRAVLSAFEYLHDRYPELLLVIAGKISRVIARAINRHRSRDRIVALGYVDATRKQSLVRHATALIWPSFYEGFGFPPLEAARANVPVIVSYRTSLPEVCEDAAYYVNPHSVQDIVRVSRTILDRPRGVAQMPAIAERAYVESARELVTFLHEGYEADRH